ERIDVVRVRAQLGAVARAELRVALRIVREPLAQRRARRDVARPGIERRLALAETARPEPVDQHAVAVAGRRVVVDAFDAYAGLELVQDAGGGAVLAGLRLHSLASTRAIIASQWQPPNSNTSRWAKSMSLASDSRSRPLARKWRLRTVSSVMSRISAVSSTESSSTERSTNTVRNASGRAPTFASRSARICSRPAA